MINAKELEVLISLYGGPVPAIIDSTPNDWIEFFKTGQNIIIHNTVREDDIIGPDQDDCEHMYGIVYQKNLDAYFDEITDLDTFYVDDRETIPISIIDNGYLIEYKIYTDGKMSYVNFLEKKLYELEKKRGDHS